MLHIPPTSYLLLAFHFNLINAAVVCTVLESISGLAPSSFITEPRYLKLETYKKSVFLNVKYLRFFCYKNQENGPLAAATTTKKQKEKKKGGKKKEKEKKKARQKEQQVPQKKKRGNRKVDQMIALRFQTGGRHQTFPACLRRRLRTGIIHKNNKNKNHLCYFCCCYLLRVRATVNQTILGGRCWETAWRALGLSPALRYHLQLNWTVAWLLCSVFCLLSNTELRHADDTYSDNKISLVGWNRFSAKTQTIPILWPFRGSLSPSTDTARLCFCANCQPTPNRPSSRTKTGF